MGFSEIKDIVQWIGGFSAALFIFCLFYVLVKTQSFHVLRWRIWRLVVGDKEPNDPLTKAYIDEQSSLMAFRLFSKLQVRTLDEIGALQDWAKARGIGLHELSGIARFFNIADRCIKLPYPRLYRYGNGVVMLASGFLLLMAAFLGCANSANIKVTATSHWYWVDLRQARASWTDWPVFPLDTGQVLARTDCTNTAKTLPEGFTAHDREVLCDLWQQDGTTVIKSLVREQQWVSWFLAAMLLPLFGWRVRRADQLNQLKRLRIRIMAAPSGPHPCMKSSLRLAIASPSPHPSGSGGSVSSRH